MPAGLHLSQVDHAGLQTSPGLSPAPPETKLQDQNQQKSGQQPNLAVSVTIGVEEAQVERQHSAAVEVKACISAGRAGHWCRIRRPDTKPTHQAIVTNPCSQKLTTSAAIFLHSASV